jgi:hypothetical protein
MTSGDAEVVLQGMASEITTGVDLNGSAPDVRITLGPTALQRLFLDASPETADDIPPETIDFVTVMLHELGHAMGYAGYRDPATGALIGKFESVFDTFVEYRGGLPYFTGPTAAAVYGGPVPLNPMNPYHYGGTAPSLDPMSTNVAFPGRLSLSDVDLAVFQDLGLAVSHAVAGTEGADVLSSPLQGTFRGQGGDDTLIGSAKSDTLDGGLGRDTAVYGGARSAYVVARSGEVWTVESTSGTPVKDILIGVERVRFADGSLALDVEGNAGTAARLIGAVFGKAALQNKTLAGVALGLLDAGLSQQDLAALAVSTPLFASLAGSHSNRDFATLLVKNVLGAPPNAAQTVDGLVALLDGAGMTQGQMASLAAELPANAAMVTLVGLGPSGLEYIP